MTPRYIDANLAKAQFTGNFQDSYSPAEVKVLIDEVPTADVASVIHAHWIHTGEYLTNSDGKRLKKLSDLYVCHRCHRVEAVPELYCNCGAKMDENMKEEAEQ